ncbi:hypothetical protein Q7A_2460 [Methylophaga nitratireducenticrescens]|uniref:ADP-heptose:LPS heptosyltransferase n=1 Tax=Methylophaga nitratireducenticrescens TaxID=754476 RepID=I1XLJ1_METNJ|nr:MULTISPECIES: glycosyltransferase family 9 protein [Methylophaga]AFI85260.1 hypothetical protein Q7A_2460 [Methylophaga nitratireducenticrescens]|tara:strand:- start:4288 stop:5247 length:960 start_codon:yes stop_codon:yes gene_type:complete
MQSVKRIAIVPFPALGDVTICLRLAQNLTKSGCEVTLFANLITSAALNFPWLKLSALPTNPAVMMPSYDLILLDVLSPWVKDHLADLGVSKNILLFTSKNYSKSLPTKTFSNKDLISQSSGTFTNRPLCLDKNSTRSMVDWVDEYGVEVLGVKADSLLPAVTFHQPKQVKNLVVIFPTTPNPKKNFSIKGFNKLATNLIGMGFQVDIVVMPHEREQLEAKFENINVKSFELIADLIEYLRSAKVVISNDSGGGHLAAMLGISTITITRKNKNFVWRPGYKVGNVVSPMITLKFGGEHIWRPFISIKEIEKITKKIMCNS